MSKPLTMALVGATAATLAAVTPAVGQQPGPRRRPATGGPSGRALSLGRCDGRPRRRSRHQVGRRCPGPGRSEGSVVRRDARGRCREGPLRHRLQRPVRARLTRQQGGRHQDRRHQRQRAARDPALLPSAGMAVRRVVLGRAAAPRRRARSRLSLHLHAHRDRRAPRPDRRWQRKLGRPADRLAHRAGAHRPLRDHRAKATSAASASAPTSPGMPRPMSATRPACSAGRPRSCSATGRCTRTITTTTSSGT